MNELKDKLTALGLSPEMADQAITTVADYVKSKVPESYQTMIDDVMAGKSPDMGGILGGLGSLLGR